MFVESLLARAKLSCHCHDDSNDFSFCINPNAVSPSLNLRVIQIRLSSHGNNAIYVEIMRDEEIKAWHDECDYQH